MSTPAAPRSRPRSDRGSTLPAAVLVVVLAVSVVAGPFPTLSALAAPPGTGPVAAAPEPPVVAVGSFGWPLAGMSLGAAPAEVGPVTRRFLPPPTPYGRGHRGVDLAAGPGTPVVAAGDGVVAQAGPLAGRGVVSVVHAGGLRTTYEPVTAAVVTGTLVARGTVVGRLETGHRGCPAPACLHWGLRWSTPSAPPGAREQYLDPLLLVGLSRTRLWPTGDDAWSD